MNRQGQILFEITDFSRNRGQYWPDLWPEAERATIEEALAGARRGETQSFRAFCPTAAGTPKWWDTILSPVFDQLHAAPVRLLVTSRDVTTELEMRTCLSSIVESVPMALLVKDAEDGRLLLVNRAAEDLVGLPRAELLGKTDFDVFSPGRAERFRQTDLEVVASGRTAIEEEALTTRSGERRYFRTRKVATPPNDGPRRVVVLSEDVTDQKAASQALQEALHASQAAHRLQSEFLANVSHEVRTPLNGLVAIADILAGGELNPPQRELVELLQSSTAALRQLLGDVLDLTRLEAGRLEIEAHTFDLDEAIAAAAAEPAQAAAGKGLGFRIDVQSSWGTFIGDPVRLTQILRHLLANAVKFTERGEVALRVSAHGGPADIRLRFEVRDTGIGFDQELGSKLFQRFQQADGSLSRTHGGLGLGLALSSALARLMGGWVEASSRPGEGSAFVLELPFAIGETAEAPRRGPGDGAAIHDQSLRVLLAEDHPINRRVVELILATADVDLTCVENGAEAVEACRDQDFDLVLMDMQMPVMDGLAATRAIRRGESRRGRRRTPIISVTANILPEHVRASLEAGADLHLPKPLTAAALFGAIEAVLQPADAAGASALGT